jgi:cyclopropane fatty-acyl-phospholipid synthase-like methyltransferase
MFITENYKNLLIVLHKVKFFSGGNFKASLVSNLLTDIDSVIDFGCGRGEVIQELIKLHPTIKFLGYDPGVVKFEKIPQFPSDLLISMDVLEHIEPELLDVNLKLINDLFTKKALLVVASYPAGKNLPNGNNAHLIIQEDVWWEEKFAQHIQGKIVSKTSKNVDKGIEHRYLIEK